jgi:uncharacterized membrane protein
MDAHMDPAPARNAGRKAPTAVVVSARMLVAAIPLQFLLAGLMLFHDPALRIGHVALGFLLLIPVTILATAPWLRRSVRPLRWWTGLVAALTVVQVVLGAGGGGGWPKAAHVFNAALVLVAALVVAAKIERSHRG